MLLGDSAHAMQPNLGQGGCMAIEDAYQLVLDLCAVSVQFFWCLPAAVCLLHTGGWCETAGGVQPWPTV